MMTSNFIINVTEMDFEYEVVNYSQNIPVLVAFLASWSQPGRELSSLLERLVIEARALGLSRLTTQASLAAGPVFGRQGFSVFEDRTVLGMACYGMDMVL